MENKHFVTFHYGRGGKFHNPGHITGFEIGKTRYNIVCERGWLNTKDEDSNELPDEEWTYRDDSGELLLQGRDEIEADEGWLEFDGEYDKYHSCELEDCTEKELEYLYEEYLKGNISDYEDPLGEIRDYVVEGQGMARIHRIKMYRGNADVFTSFGTTALSWDGCNTDEEVMETWEYFCEDNNIDPRSVELFKGEFENRIFFN